MLHIDGGEHIDAILFLPKMLRTVMGLFGGEVAPQDDDASYSRPAPDWGHSAPSQPKAPGQR